MKMMKKEVAHLAFENTAAILSLYGGKSKEKYGNAGCHFWILNMRNVKSRSFCGLQSIETVALIQSQWNKTR